MALMSAVATFSFEIGLYIPWLHCHIPDDLRTSSTVLNQVCLAKGCASPLTYKIFLFAGRLLGYQQRNKHHIRGQLL